LTNKQTRWKSKGQIGNLHIQEIYLETGALKKMKRSFDSFREAIIKAAL
jgi:hypothetical protein